MKWNVALLIVSLALLALFFGSGLTQYPMAAEAIAEDLAPEIGVSEDVIRTHLRPILASGSLRRTVVNCSPLAVLSTLNAVRLVADAVQRKRRNEQVVA